MEQAIILWEREALQTLFSTHPGYVISEDWYFGYIAQQAGYRIDFCSQVFVETETPPCLLWDSSSRGGYGEMTVWKQRFYRWNHFFLFRIVDDTRCLLFNWRLGWRELTAKYECLIEIVDSIMNLLRPFVFVISVYLNAKLTFEYMAILTYLYGTSFGIFNLWHLRNKNEMVTFKVLPVYFFMKFVLLWFGSASMYYGLLSYITYFSETHPKVVENNEALEAAYNIRLGTKLMPLAESRKDLIEQVEQLKELEEDGENEVVVVSSHLKDDLESGLSKSDDDSQ